MFFLLGVRQDDYYHVLCVKACLVLEAVGKSLHRMEAKKFYDQNLTRVI